MPQNSDCMFTIGDRRFIIGLLQDLQEQAPLPSELVVFRCLTLWEELYGVISDSMTETEHRERIWFFPHKFWQATKNMPKDEAANLMAEVERYAAAGDVQALSKYPFVFVGDPYKKKKKNPAA